jgi:hypothetical protein
MGMGSVGKGNPTGAERIYIQLTPKCLTNIPVQGCRGHLVRVYTKGIDDAWTPTPLNESLQLKWSLRNEEEITLEPFAETKLNVCYSECGVHEITLDVMKCPARLTGVLGIPGVFRFDIMISANESHPVKVSLVVTFNSENFDDIVCTLHQGWPKT